VKVTGFIWLEDIVDKLAQKHSLLLSPLLIIFLFVTGCSNLLLERGTTLPIRLKDILPTNWQPIQEPTVINVDGDDPPEWLLLFRYNEGPIGAVVYDAQNDASPYSASEKLPFQPTAFLVPYALLPNTEKDRGQGYIGDDRAEFKQIDGDLDKRKETLLLRGYWNGVPTRLTMAWWISQAEGYGIAHVTGDGGIEFEDAEFWQKEDQQLKAVITRHRRNDRSNFCLAKRYRVDFKSHTFTWEYSWLTFCGKVPSDPIYPEGTVLSFLLRQKDPPDQEGKTVFNRLMTDAGQAAWKDIFGEKAFQQRSVMRVLLIENPGPLADKVTVRTDHRDDFGRHRLVWELVRQRPTRIEETVTWRINGVWLESD
jgi:hypothetical protein